MHKKELIAFISVLLILFGTLFACTDASKENEKTHDGKAAAKNGTDKNKGKGEESWKEALKAPESPKTLEDVVNYPKGSLSDLHLVGNAQDLETAFAAFEKLPKLDDRSGEEELAAYWNKALSLFAEDYPDPKNILQQLKYANFGNPDIGDAKFQFKENLNVEILLDASGSMGAMINGKTKMQMAKEAIRGFASSLPEGARVGLRVYGHKGTGSDKDKSLSCGSTELVYNIQTYNSATMDQALNKFQPKGWTPIALALNEAQKDLSKYPAETNTNIVYLVSDGISTCDGDPVQAAKTLAQSNIDPIVNIVGFDIDQKGQAQLKEMAKAADGLYTTAENQEELSKQFDSAESIARKWNDWKKNADIATNNTYYKKYFDIFGFVLDWQGRYIDEYDNLWYTFDELKEKGYLSQAAYDYLMTQNKNRKQMLRDYTDQINETLNDINEKNYKEAKQEIEDKFNANTK